MFEWCSMAEISTSSPALHVLAAVAVGDQVDRLGRAARADDLLDGSAALRKRCTLHAGVLVGGGGALAQLVDAAVDVGAVREIELADRVDHRQRRLRRGGVVEVGERLAVYRLIERREVFAQRGRVERLQRGGAGQAWSGLCSSLLLLPLALSGSCSIRARASASSSARPRSARGSARSGCARECRPRRHRSAGCALPCG